MDMVPHSKDVLFFKRNKKVLKWVAIFGTILTIVMFTYFFKIDLFNHPEIIQERLESTGTFAPIVFFVLSIVNTFYPIVPGGLGNVIGYTMFGAVFGFTLVFIANFIGSFILFSLAKRFGKPILYAFLDEKTVEKGLGYLDRGYYIEWVLAVLFIVPGLPDELFLMIAGFSDLSYKRMIIIQLIFKPVTMFLYMAGVHNFLRLLSNLF
ncbi:TVP38/TMEM64 family protein [Aerococcaceae bacterium DSM 111021]|nr:TVP38/TMEM64 family protein [Aerococcaceae bacterium DSM 111021]